jgi:long-chain fatty acid transport protein
MCKRILPVLALILAWAPSAGASGFQLREQSASEQGDAFAGASAGAQDISSMFWNPAAMALFDGTQVFLGGSYIKATMDLSGASGTRAPGFQPGNLPISGGPDLPNAVNQPVVPALYVARRLSEQWSVGLSVNVPFGLVTNYPGDFVGRYYGLETSLKTYDIAPAVAWKNDAWTLGLALVARKAEATITNAVDFGAIGNSMGVPGFIPGGSDGTASLSGDCWSYGYKLGATWAATPDLRFGVGYQAQTTLDVKGFVGYQGVPGAFAASITDSDAEARIKLPATASAGATWQLTPTFSLAGEIAWTGWSCFNELRVTFASGQADDVTEENWKDTMFYSLGAIWKVSPQWSLKGGLAYDRSPVDNQSRTPRIPDSDRTWISVGAGWAADPRTSIDLGLTQIFAPNVNVGLTSGNVPTDPNYYRGNLTGVYKVGITIVALSVRHQF